jgi:hypothetical protein
MLHVPVKDVKGNAWCGPTAISSITQTPVSTIQKMVRRIRGPQYRYIERKRGGGYIKKPYKAPVRGMYDNEVIEVMRRLKFNLIEEKSFKGTFKSFCEDYGHAGPFIVQVTRHYIAVSKGMACDTYSKTPIPWQDHPLLRKQVKRYIKFA